MSIKERPFLTQETILDIRDMIAETDFEYQREAFVDTRDLERVWVSEIFDSKFVV